MTFLQRIKRIRCWIRGYHISAASDISKFRYDVDGMCYDCGKVGDGVNSDPGE